MDIFKLVGSIFIDNTEANESLAKTDKKAESVGSTLTSALGTAAKFGAALVGAAASASAAMYGLATSTAEQADAIDKGAIRMGISTDYYQQLEYAASQCGVSMSTLEKAAKKLEGTDISMDSAIESIMALGTAEERTQKACELFGDSVAYNLSPILESSGDDFQGLIDKASELGMVMDADSVASGVELNDTLDTLSKSFSSIVSKIGTAFMPLFQQVADGVIEFIPVIQEFVSDLLPGISASVSLMIPVFMQVVESIMPVMMDILEQIAPIMLDLVAQVLPVFLDLIVAIMPSMIELTSELLPVAVELLAMLLPVATDLIAEVLPPLVDIIIELIPLLTVIIRDVLPIVIDLIKYMIPVLGDILKAMIPVVGAIVQISTALVKNLVPAFEFVKNMCKPILKFIRDIFTETFKDIERILNNLIQFVKNVASGNFKAALGNIIDIARTYLDSLVFTFKSVLNLIGGFWNTIANTYNSMDLPQWITKLVGHDMHLNLPIIPQLAKGGKIDVGGATLIGENGPELLNLPTGSQVTPLRASDLPFKASEDSDEVVNKLDEMIAQIVNLAGAMANQKVYLDGNVLVGGIASRMDESMAVIGNQKARYV